MRQNTVIKIVVAIAALGVLGVLFVRSAKSVSAEPYTMSRAGLSPWTVVLASAPEASGVTLGLKPPDQMAPPLFSQLFTRSGLSLSGPSPVVMPLLLKSEFDRAVSGRIELESLVALAKQGSLESLQPKPQCLATRRVSQPGSTRDVFFVRFEHAPLAEFRQQVAERLGAAGATAGFDPLALSPIVIVAGSDGDFRSWLPLQGTATQDCLAPIELR